MNIRVRFVSGIRVILVGVFLAAFVIACGEKDNHSQFLGYYKTINKWNSQVDVLEIKADGNSFLMDDGTGKIYPLEKRESGLMVQNQLMTLSDDKEILYLSGRELPRVTEQWARDLSRQRKEAEINCRELDRQALVKQDEISDKREWNKYIKDLASRKPEGCRLVNATMRF